MTKETRLDPNNLGDQFRGEMEMQENGPWTIGFTIVVDGDDSAVLMTQTGSNPLHRCRVIFHSPEHLRGVAKSMLEFSDEWERGTFSQGEPNGNRNEEAAQEGAQAQAQAGPPAGPGAAVDQRGGPGR